MARQGHDEVSRHACPDFNDAQLCRYQSVKGNDGSTANIPGLIAVIAVQGSVHIIRPIVILYSPSSNHPPPSPPCVSYSA